MVAIDHKLHSCSNDYVNKGIQSNTLACYSWFKPVSHVFVYYDTWKASTHATCYMETKSISCFFNNKILKPMIGFGSLKNKIKKKS